MNAGKKRLVIVGVGGHALAAWDLASQMELDIACFLVPPNSNGFISNYILNSEIPVLNFDKAVDFQSMSFFIAIGDNYHRKTMKSLLQDLGVVDFPNLISKSSFVSKHSMLGSGNFIGNFANIGVFSTLKDFIIVNSKASIDHENLLQDFVSLAPGVVTGGRVGIGSLTFVGMNSAIRQDLKIGENCLIGALSYVNTNLQDNTVAWGNPSKIRGQRSRNQTFTI